jgi:hypothetical protein
MQLFSQVFQFQKKKLRCYVKMPTELSDVNENWNIRTAVFFVKLPNTRYN